MKKRIGVLAGNIHQFRYYLRENGLNESDAVFVYDSHSIFGRELSKVVTYGTWYEWPNARRLLKLAETRVR